MKTQGSLWLNFAPALIVSALLAGCGGSDHDGGPQGGCADAPCTQDGPAISSQPAAAAAAVGGTATFSVTATGSSPLVYQWYRNGAAIAGAQSSTYTTPVLTSADDGAQYTVQITDTKGSVTSAGAALKVSASAGGAKGLDVVYIAYHSSDVGLAGESALSLFVDSDMTAIDPGSILPFGSTTLSLGGAAFPSEGDNLPLSGTLTSTYANARTSQDPTFTSYDGSASVTYDFKTASNPVNFDGQPYSGTLTITTNKLHVVNKDTDATFDADFTANGTGSADFASTLSGGNFTGDMTYHPGAGSTLAEADSGLTATYVSGSMTTHVEEVPQQGILIVQKLVYTYASLTFTIGGTSYVADGSMTIQIGSGGNESGSGQILVKQGSTTVGRIFADGSGPHFDVGGTISPIH